MMILINDGEQAEKIISEVEGEIREFLRHDEGNLRCHRELNCDVVRKKLTQYFSGWRVPRWKILIGSSTSWQSRRDLLSREGARVQGDIVQLRAWANR